MRRFLRLGWSLSRPYFPKFDLTSEKPRKPTNWVNVLAHIFLFLGGSILVHPEKRGVSMRLMIADPTLVAACGLYCGSCGAYLKEECGGCLQSEEKLACGVRKCVIQKGMATCAHCGTHPEAMDCKKYNSATSTAFGSLSHCGRPSCLEEVRVLGLKAFSQKNGDY